MQLAQARARQVVTVGRRNATVDSTRADWVEQAKAALGPQGADVVLDNVGGDLGEAAFALAAPGGRFSAHGAPSGRFAAVDRHAGVSVTGIEAAQLSTPDRITYLGQALAAGELEPAIGQTFPLDQAGAAHATIESRTVLGKTLITV